MSAAWTSPGLLTAKLATVWASRYGALKRCLLRQAATVGGQTPLMPQTPRAALGSAIHRLFERAAGDPVFPFSQAGLSLEWERAIAEVKEFISRSKYMEGMLPLSRSIPNLGLLRSRTLLRIVEGGRPAPVSRIQRTPAEKTTFPGRLSNKSGTVVGIPDRINKTPEGIVIVDYKTGMTAEMRSRFWSDYELQLKIYAGLYFLSSGDWPIRLELHGLDNSVCEVVFTSDECSQVMGNAESLAATLPSSTADLSGNIEAQKATASPAKDVCRYCTYRPACPGYLALIETQSDLACESDLYGTFRDWKTLGNGEYLMEMQHESGSVRIRNLPPVDHLTAALQSAVPGEKVLVLNVLKTEDLTPLFSSTPFTAIHSYGEKSP
jgi:RecB family exonuclease